MCANKADEDRNNITRMLKARGIPFLHHIVPAEKLSAIEVASLLSVPQNVVFKTIVIKRIPGKPIFALVPGNREVDLKLLAKLVNEKKIQLATQEEAERITSMHAGGISPLAFLNRGYTFIIDQSCNDHQQIIISGGQRGLLLQIAPNDLIRLMAPRIGMISRPE